MVGQLQLLEELRERGFIPDEDGGDWADLPIGGTGPLSVPRAKVRVAADDTVTAVYVMTGNGVTLWDVKLSDATPLDVITTVTDLAIARAYTSA